MANIKYSSLGFTITPPVTTKEIDFSTLDSFTFDGDVVGFSASQITSLTDVGGKLTIVINGNTITFDGITSDQVDSSKFIFDDGSRILFGDGTVSTVNDAGNNTLLSTDYDDYIDGFTGVNTVSYKNAGSAVTVDLTAAGGVQTTVGAGNDKLVNIQNVTGSNFNDTLNGGAGVNILDGGLGFDTMNGKAGDDIYIVNPGDTILDGAIGDASSTTSGTDTVQSAFDFSLVNATNVENLTLTGSTAIMATGNASVNTIRGNSAGNIIDGGAGADFLLGGAGNDTYLIDNTGDQIQEETAANGTADWVVSTASTYTLATGVENMRLIGATQVSTITIAGALTAGLTITVSGIADANVVLPIPASPTPTNTAEALIAAINTAVGAKVVATSLAGVVTLTAKVAGTPFTAVANSTDTDVTLTLATPTSVGVIGIGNTLANTLIGGRGNDVFNGTEGNDSITDQLGGNDTLIGGDG